MKRIISHAEAAPLSHAEATALFRYDRKSGLIWWRNPRTESMRRSATSTLDHNGYVVIQYANVRYLAHRLAWFLVKGYWPVEIDHKNRVRNDNRWANLREATRSQNRANGVAHVSNRLGVRGVHKLASGKFCVQIQINKKRMRLGHFSTLDEATETYRRAAKHYFGEFTRL